jgi:ankyrin repeat protein
LIDVLKYLIPLVPTSLLTETNENGSPPLHWAILNNHVAVVQQIVELPEDQGGGIQLLKVGVVPAPQISYMPDTRLYVGAC